MRQVNIRLSDEEYDQLVRECGPGATVSGYVTVLVRQHLAPVEATEFRVDGKKVSGEEFYRVAEERRSRRLESSSGAGAPPPSPGATVGGKKPVATNPEKEWRPFTKDQQLGKGKRR